MFFQELGRRIKNESGEPQAYQFLLQRILAAVQWGNAAAESTHNDIVHLQIYQDSLLYYVYYKLNKYVIFIVNYYFTSMPLHCVGQQVSCDLMMTFCE